MEVPRRLSLLLEVAPHLDSKAGVVHLSNMHTETDLAIRAVSLVLTLEHDGNDRVARGHVQLSTERGSHVIQTDVSLFDALVSYIASVEEV
jgi:hypothetical protein